MSNTVFCRKHQKDLPALAAAPFPGPAGQDILENVSAQAWQEWLEHQTRLINEKHLNMMNKGDRQYLNEQRGKFLEGGDFDHAEGYVPENKA